MLPDLREHERSGEWVEDVVLAGTALPGHSSSQTLPVAPPDLARWDALAMPDLITVET